MDPFRGFSWWTSWYYLQLVDFQFKKQLNMSPDYRRWKRRFLLKTIIYRFQCYFWDLCTLVYHWNLRRVCKLRVVFCSLLKNDFSASESDGLVFPVTNRPKHSLGTPQNFHSLKLTAKDPWKWAIPQGNSSSNHPFLGANILVSGRVYTCTLFSTCHGFTFFFFGSSPEWNIDETPWEKRT